MPLTFVCFSESWSVKISKNDGHDLIYERIYVMLKIIFLSISYYLFISRFSYYIYYIYNKLHDLTHAKNKLRTHGRPLSSKLRLYSPTNLHSKLELANSLNVYNERTNDIAKMTELGFHQM